MRVLEGESISTYKMGKNKKHRLRKSKENEAGGSDSTDENGAAPSAQLCPHINRSVNLAAMRKAISKTTFGECVACNREKKPNKEKEVSTVGASAGGETTDIDEGDHETTVWVCLQCGSQGCDRNSKDKHALKHFENTGGHCVTVNLSTWLCWCYTCDEFIPVDSHKRIQECVETLRKQSGLFNSEHSSGRRVLEAVSNNPQPRIESQPEITSTKDKSRPLTPKSLLTIVCQKVKGLSNLGNTCFFNAVMQNLCQSHSLETLLTEKTEKGHTVRLPGRSVVDTDSGGSSEEEEEDDVCHKQMASIEIVPGEIGPLTQSLLGFISEMNKGASKGSSSSSTVNPSALFGQICKKAPRFKGFQQQDSHELLRYLLDVIRTEEIKRCQTGILKYFNVNLKTVDEETKSKVKEYGRQAKHTFIDSLFGGQLVSTVMCEECKHISQIFEPFLDLSLPVTEEKPLRPNMMVGSKKKSLDEDLPFAAKTTDGASKEKSSGKHLSKKGKKQLRKEQRRKGKVVAKSHKQEDPVFSDGLKEEDGDEGKEETTNDERRESLDGDKEEKDDSLDPSDADIEDNLEVETSKLYGGATATAATTNSTTVVPTITRDPASPSIGTSNNLIPGDPSISNNLLGDSNNLLASSQSVGSCNNLIASSQSIGTSNNLLGDSNNLMASSPSLGSSNNLMASSSSLGTSNNLIALNNSNPELQNTLVPSSSQWTLNGRSDDAGSGLDPDSSSVTLVDNDSSTLLTSTESSLTTSSVGSSQKAKSTDSSRSSTCDIKYEQDDVDGNCFRKGLSDSLNDLHLEDSRSRLSAMGDNQVEDSRPLLGAKGGNPIDDLEDRLSAKGGNLSAKGGNLSDDLTNKLNYIEDSNSHLSAKGGNLVNDLTKKLNYLNLDVTGSTSSVLDMKDIPYIDSVESPDVSEISGHSVSNQDLPPLELNGVTDQNCVNSQKSKRALRKEAECKSMLTLSPRYQSAGKECSISSCLHQFTSAELLTGSNKVSCEKCTRIKNKKSSVNKGEKKKSETVYSNASKQYLIFQPPAVLTLHLKRFEQVGFASRKVNRHVDFPLLLDLSPYCSALCQGVQPGQKRILYSLYGVVEHSGRLSGGHYTAFVKVRTNINSVASFTHPSYTFPKDYIQRYVERSIHGQKTPDSDISDRTIESLVPPGKWYHISDSHVREVSESAVLHAQAYLLFYERIF